MDKEFGENVPKQPALEDATLTNIRYSYWEIVENSAELYQNSVLTACQAGEYKEEISTVSVI